MQGIHHTDPDPVQCVVETLRYTLGESFSLSQLILYLEAWRQKPLRIEHDQMPIGMTGYCLALHDCDLVCVRPDLDELLEHISLLHELAHFLLGHVTARTNTVTVTYETFIRNRNTIAILPRQRFDADYDKQREHDAEALATVLFDLIQKQKNDIPHAIKYLHG